MKSLGITVLAFILSMIMVNPLSFSMNSIFSMPEKEDFNISDFYSQVSDRRPVRTVDGEVVLVDIGEKDRYELSEVFSDLALCGPRVIGIDIMFSEEGIMGKEIDSLLIMSIKEMSSVCPVVFPIDVESDSGKFYKIKEKPFFYDRLPTLSYGATNLPSKFKGGVIREMSVEYSPFESFPVSIVSKAFPEKVQELKKKGSSIEMIDYASREFKVVSASEISERSEELTDKILLVGSLSDITDQHATPLKSQVFGLNIHANSVSTIIGGRYYTGLGKYWDWCSAVILCYMVTLLGFLVNAKVKGLVVRILQLLLVYLAVQIGYSLFVDHRIIINFTYTLLMVTFGLFAADIWNGTEGIIGILKEKKKQRT